MADKYINKVIIGNDVKLDLTADDITADKLAKGIKAHDKSGAPIVGTSTFDSDTSGDNAVAAALSAEIEIRNSSEKNGPRKRREAGRYHAESGRQDP